MRWTEATCSLAALVVCRLSDALAAASKSGFALAQPATDEMWKHVSHGDLVFAHPALDLSQPLDNAIIAVGAATTDWLRQTEHRIIVGNETATHVGIAVRSIDYSLYILEATPPSVRLTPAHEFVENLRNLNRSARLYRGIVAERLREKIPAAVAAALAQLGKPYADDFEPPSSGRFYCSSLVDFAFSQAMHAPHVFVREDFKLIFVPHEFWARYYQQLGKPLPSNVSGSNPTLLMHSSLVELHRIS